MSRGLGRREGVYWRRSIYGRGGGIYMGPNQASLLYDWTPTPDNVTLNGADAVSVLCRDRNYNVIVGNEFVQNTGARQALWNATDADLGGQPTLEFAGAEQYQTANAITLPTQCTVVAIAKDENAGAFASLFEHSTFYSASNGGLVLYSSANLFAGLNFTGQTLRVLGIPVGGKTGWVVSFDLSQVGAAAFPLARVNNSAMGATGFNASTAGTFRSAALMCGGRAASTFWTGPWARTRVYTGTFTSAQADAEYAYQKALFGLP
jgi:hypothetical protein